MYGTCPLRVVMKLICSTFKPCRCIVSRRTLVRDTYWFSVFSRDLTLRYWPVTSDMSLYSRMQNTSVFVSVVTEFEPLYHPVSSVRNCLQALVPYCCLTFLNSFNSSHVRVCSISRSLVAFQIVSFVIFRYCKTSISTESSLQKMVKRMWGSMTGMERKRTPEGEK